MAAHVIGSPPVNNNCMNYLAHQFLSFDHDAVMVGNFIADTLRGSKTEQFPEEVRLGIEIHRFIDGFTDTHLLPLATRKLLYRYFGKYAAVVQDIFYDHFLALQWDRYHHLPLSDFAEKVYLTVGMHPDALNARAARVLHYMSADDWLTGYARREGIDRALKGMASRAKFESNMERSLPALDAHFDEMNQHFSTFFPELRMAVHENFASRITN